MGNSSKNKKVKPIKAKVWNKLNTYKPTQVDLFRWNENEREKYEIELKKLQDELALVLQTKDSSEKDTNIRRLNEAVEDIDYLRPQQETISIVVNSIKGDIMAASKAARKGIGLTVIGDFDGKTEDEIKALQDAQPEIDEDYLTLYANACMVAQCLVEGPKLEGNNLTERGKDALNYFTSQELQKLANALFNKDFSNFF